MAGSSTPVWHLRVVLALAVSFERVAAGDVEEAVGGGVVQSQLLASVALAEHVEHMVRSWERVGARWERGWDGRAW